MVWPLMMPVSSSGDFTSVVRSGTLFGSGSNCLAAGAGSTGADAGVTLGGLVTGLAAGSLAAGVGEDFAAGDSVGFFFGLIHTLASGPLWAESLPFSFGALATGATFLGTIGGLAGPTLLFLSVNTTGEAFPGAALRGTGSGIKKLISL